MDQRVYDEDGNTVLQLATHTNQYQIIQVSLRDTNVSVNAVNADGYNALAISEMNNINASSSEFGIREMIINKQRHIVDVDSSRGAGDHSSGKAKDCDKELAVTIKNGILVLCSLLATFCLGTILSLPGGIGREQLQSKPMNNITDGQLDKYQSFLNYDVSCFVISVTTIFLVTITSSCHYKYSLHLDTFMMGVIIISATLLFYEGLVLATNDRFAHVAFVRAIGSFFIFMAGLFIFLLWVDQERRSFIRNKCIRIRDLIKWLLCLVLSFITR